MRQRFLFCVLTPLLLMSCGADAQEPTGTQLLIPTAPGRAVLHVTVAPNRGVELPAISATLFGDGRLELHHSEDGEFTRQLSTDEVQSLIDRAVSHGLMEYDSEVLRAKAGPSAKGYDGTTATVLLALEDSSHGRPREKVIRKVHPISAAEQYPQIPEFQALGFLARWPAEMVRVAKSEKGAIKKPVPFSDAEYSLPADPTRAILRVESRSLGMEVFTATLYGDGQLKLTHNIHGNFSRQLEHTEVQTIMDQAIGLGLMEYDSMTVLAKALTLRQGQRPPINSDSGSLTVLLSVNDYVRGGFRQPMAENRIHANELRITSRRYPEISEVQGLERVVRWAFEELELARAKGNS